MGWLGSLWLSEDITQLEDFKKTLSDPEEIAEIDEKIATLKAKAEAEADGKDE